MPKKPTKKTTPKKSTKKGAKKNRASKVVEAPDLPNRSETMSIRKIANGYIVTKDSYSPKGGYKSTETFTKVKPKLEIKV